MADLSMHYRHDVSLGMVAPVRIADKSTNGHNIPENSQKKKGRPKKGKRIDDHG